MTQDEAELKEFFVVMNKLKQKALLAKLLSIGLVAISGLLVAGSIGYMIFEVTSLRSSLDECRESKAALSPDTNSYIGINGDLTIQNSNRSIQNNSSPGKPIATVIPQSSIKPTAETSANPIPTAIVTPPSNKTIEDTAKPLTSNKTEANAKRKGNKGDDPTPNPNKTCAEIFKSLSMAHKNSDPVTKDKLQKQYNDCRTKKPR